jgi:hypothetical protein
MADKTELTTPELMRWTHGLSIHRGENSRREILNYQRSLSARYENARRGELVVALPVGFVKVGDRLEKDPDRRVQQAITLGRQGRATGQGAPSASRVPPTSGCSDGLNWCSGPAIGRIRAARSKRREG